MHPYQQHQGRVHQKKHATENKTINQVMMGLRKEVQPKGNLQIKLVTRKISARKLTFNSREVLPTSSPHLGFFGHNTMIKQQPQWRRESRYSLNQQIEEGMNKIEYLKGKLRAHKTMAITQKRDVVETNEREWLQQPAWKLATTLAKRNKNGCSKAQMLRRIIGRNLRN